MEKNIFSKELREDMESTNSIFIRYLPKFIRDIAIQRLDEVNIDYNSKFSILDDFSWKYTMEGNDIWSNIELDSNIIPFYDYHLKNKKIIELIEIIENDINELIYERRI